MRLNPFYYSLRAKFLSIIFLVLLFPLTSVFLLKEVEKTLVSNLKQNLLLSANLISLQLESHTEWFNEIQLPESEGFVAREFYIFPFDKTIIIDGFFDEWQFIERFRSEFRESASLTQDNQLGVLLASYQDHLYLSLKVVDEKIIYAKDNPGFRSDQLGISFLDQYNNPGRVFISPLGSGEVAVARYQEDRFVIDQQYLAIWQETDDGFNLELRFPEGFKPKELRVTHHDVDKPGQSNQKARVSTSGIELNPLLWPSQSIEQFFAKIELLPGQRASVLDTQGRILTRKGNLQNISLDRESSGIISWLLTNNSSTLADQRKNLLRLNSAVIYDALKGRPSSLIETDSQGDSSIALAAMPILSDGKVIGIVLIEENVAKIQLLQRETLGQMLDVAALIFVIILLLIMAYVSKVVMRITRLKNKVNEIVDEQGRISMPPEVEYVEGDEIDDLTYAFTQMGTKLYDYNDYLEKLASRLSHELRTPIAIVRSSLDNLLLNLNDDDSKQIILRALEGTQRLGEIISRMRQASGVKSAMQSAAFEEIDFYLMLKQITEGFSHSFPQHQFQFVCESDPVICQISTDLMAELLDKLLSNAMDFSTPDTTITVALKKTSSEMILSVSNQGNLIPRKNLRKIFQSLVSIRSNQSSNDSNLGLGLYIVKLIADFHGAKVKAENLPDGSGVKFSVVWSLQNNNAKRKNISN